MADEINPNQYWKRYPSVEFAVGPPKSYFELFGHRHAYETLTNAGLKAELAEVTTEADVNVAWENYWGQLDAYLDRGKAVFVFWRVEPSAEKIGDRYWIRSRLVIVEKANG